MSQVSLRVRRPPDSISDATSSIFSLRRPDGTTSAPAAASPRLRARPIPDVPPMTTATLLDKFRLSGFIYPVCLSEPAGLRFLRFVRNSSNTRALDRRLLPECPRQRFARCPTVLPVSPTGYPVSRDSCTDDLAVGCVARSVPLGLPAERTEPLRQKDPRPISPDIPVSARSRQARHFGRNAQAQAFVDSGLGAMARDLHRSAEPQIAFSVCLPWNDNRRRRRNAIPIGPPASARSSFCLRRKRHIESESLDLECPAHPAVPASNRPR